VRRPLAAAPRYRIGNRRLSEPAGVAKPRGRTRSAAKDVISDNRFAAALMLLNPATQFRSHGNPTSAVAAPTAKSPQQALGTAQSVPLPAVSFSWRLSGAGRGALREWSSRPTSESLHRNGFMHCSKKRE
jgi:hypothetical protein